MHYSHQKVGMAEYKDFLESKGIKSKPTMSGCELVPQPLSATPTAAANVDQKLVEQVESLFHTLDTNNDGLINLQDAERLLLKLNTVYGRSYGEVESKAFYDFLSTNKSNQSQLDLNTVKKAFALDQKF